VVHFYSAVYKIKGEAVCFDSNGWGYYTTSEGATQPIHYFASVNSNLSVTEIMSASAHSGSTDGDWWELTYAGSSTVDLTGYSWDDNSNIAGTVTFGNITIGPGESVIILDDNGSWVASWKGEWALGSDVNVYDHSHFSGTFPGLGSSDGIFLYDSCDVLITSAVYPSRTTGISNEWDTDGTFLGLSVIGENDAYQSLNASPDVGSPDNAVIILDPILTTIYVDADAAPDGNGTSWATAYKYLQDALDDALVNDKIHVAQGIYKPDEDEGGNVTPGDREASFWMKTGVSIQGGYAGYGEPNPYKRNIEIYESILSGDLDDNDVNVADACDLLGEPTRGENSYRVVTAIVTDETAVLDGFTIIGGNANGPFLSSGGGIYIQSGNPTIINCTLIGNSANTLGGGISNSGNAMVLNCAFSDNAANNDGGGMANLTHVHSIVTNCTFSSNYAGQTGGGVYNRESDTKIINCMFSGNLAVFYGGGISNYELANPIVTNCTFSGNSADVGGGLYNDPTSDLAVMNSIFWNNNDSGGVDESAQVHNDGSASDVNYTCIQGWAGGLGGTGNHGDNPLFVDANGVDNIPGTEDDNLQLSASSPCFDAGDNAAVPPDIADLDGDVNTTEPTPWDLDGNPRIINGTVDMGAYELGPKTETCCADFNGDLFVNFYDFCLLAQEWLETGDSLEMDLIDDDKIDELDLAAFVERWLSPCYLCSEADIYSDGKIDFNDYSILANNWLKEGPNLDGDITGNWIVNMLDLKVLVFHWLNSCE
jgi:hypothetical protein